MQVIRLGGQSLYLLEHFFFKTRSHTAQAGLEFCVAEDSLASISQVLGWPACITMPGVISITSISPSPLYQLTSKSDGFKFPITCYS